MPWPKPADFNFDTRLSSFSLAIEGKKKKKKKGRKANIVGESYFVISMLWGEFSRGIFFGKLRVYILMNRCPTFIREKYKSRKLGIGLT